MMGYLLHPIKSTNDSRQDLQLEDWLSNFIKNISINLDGPLIPTIDITQKQIMDSMCYVNLVTVDEFSVLHNGSKIHNVIIEKILNTTVNTHLTFPTIEGFGKIYVIEAIIIATGIIGNFLTIVYIPL